MKKILIISAWMVVVGCCVNASVADAASKVSQLDFEDNYIDSYGWATLTWDDGLTLEQCSGAQYVPGRTGKSIRTSHNYDDGCRDLIINGASYGDNFFASNEVYYSYWMKFEEEYENISNNAKTIWEGIPGTGYGHQEGAWTGPLNGIVEHRWQWSGDGTGWDAGTDVTKYSGHISYNPGDWMHVEFYVKLSTGLGHMNPDGLAWFKVNDETYIYDDNLITGEMGRVALPGINGTIDQPAGHGWWQIDDYEVWDGLPDQPITETCTDNIQNQDETGIDCGGVCDVCIIPTTYTLTNFISAITNWLGVGNETSDVNSDGVVNTRDLGIVMSGWSE